MSFGFFIVAALDLLDALDTAISASERQSWIEWIYACQVPHTGGFRGFTGTNLGGLRSPMNWHWDPASLPNTYFALATLIILGDDLGRVLRNECLRWIGRLQGPDGSFGEFLGPEGEIVGGSDPRLCLCAVGTLKILGADQTTPNATRNTIDESRLRRFIANCQVSRWDQSLGYWPNLDPWNRDWKAALDKRHYWKHTVRWQGWLSLVIGNVLTRA